MKFSVVTPSFGQLMHLGKCVASVHDQEGIEVEHWIQDGGTSGFDEWLKNLKAQLPSNAQKLDGISEPDAGMYDAINKGWKKATGDVLSWLNCDEQYLPGTLAKVARYFDEHPEVQLVYGDVILTDLKGNPRSYRKMIPLDQMHLRHCFLPLLSAGMFVRCEFIHEQGLYLDSRWKAIADLVWIDHLMSLDTPMGIISSPLAVFALTGENLGQSDVCAKEGKIWRKELNLSRGWRKPWVSLKHRLTKFSQGGYKQRNLEIGIYISSIINREIKRGIVGGRWN